MSYPPSFDPYASSSSSSTVMPTAGTSSGNAVPTAGSSELPANASSSAATTAAPGPYHIAHGATSYQQMVSRSTNQNQQPLLFSQSGFDIVGVLTRVATRPNQQVFIGPVDFSCAFIVADANAPDWPILYASPALAKMTGYSVSDFLGKACRFLQWPNGGRTKESPPMNTPARAEIKHALMSNSEVQTVLLNYRKTGEPFHNLVTIVPVAWDDRPDHVRYWVGFQVDVSASESTRRSLGIPEGFAREIGMGFGEGDERMMRMDAEQRSMRIIPAGAHAPVSDKLKAIVGRATSDDAQRERIFDFLEENLDDFAMAISSDGIIHHAAGLSHSLTSIGFSAHELVGKNIAAFIHPSDSERIINELAEFRFVSEEAPRSGRSEEIQAFYERRNRMVRMCYRVLVKRGSAAGDVNRNASGGVKRSTRARSNRHHPYSHPTSTSNPFPIPTEPTYEWVESTGRIYIESPGKSLIILSTRVIHLPPRLSYAMIDSVGGFGSGADGAAAAGLLTKKGGDGTGKKEGSAWMRIAADTGIVLSVTGIENDPEDAMARRKGPSTSTSNGSLPSSSSNQSLTASGFVPSHSHTLSSNTAVSNGNNSNSAHSSTTPPTGDSNGSSGNDRTPPFNRSSSDPHMAKGSSYIQDLLGAQAPYLVGSRLMDWIAPEFLPQVDSALNEIRFASSSSASSPGSMPRPKQVTAIVLSSPTTSDKEREAKKYLNDESSARLVLPSAGGKPAILTFFPSSEGPDGMVVSDLSANGNGNGTARGLPVSTPFDAYDALRYPQPSSSSAPSTTQNQTIPQVMPHPLARRSDPSTSSAFPALPARNKKSSSLSSESTLFVRISSPLHAAPLGMVSATGVPQTNQAYLYDPFSEMKPPSSSKAANSQQDSVVASNAPAPPPQTQTQTQTQAQQVPSSTTALPMTLSAPAEDIFETLFPTPANPAIGPTGRPVAHPRWEDQLESLRTQNARMRKEVEELLDAKARDDLSAQYPHSQPQSSLPHPASQSRLGQAPPQRGSGMIQPHPLAGTTRRGTGSTLPLDLQQYAPDFARQQAEQAQAPAQAQTQQGMMYHGAGAGAQGPPGGRGA